MAQRVRFTAGRVAGFSCPSDKSQAFLWDSDTPGLALRATRGGAKSYIFESRLQGRTLRLTIGETTHWTIEAARARAREWAAMIDKGIDPRLEIERQRQEVERQRQEAQAAYAAEQAAKMPALVAWDAYCEDRRSEWGERHYRDHIKLSAAGGAPKKRGQGVTQPGPLRELLERPLSELTPDVIDAWAKRQTHRPTSARLALRLLSVFFNWCRTHPQYRHIVPTENPAQSRRAREALGPARRKGDALQREQLRPWFAAVREQHPVIAVYLQCLLLTGARPGEMLALGWQDVDFQWASLTLRDKVEGERIIPLTPYVALLLSSLPRRGPYVFMTGMSQGPIAPPNHQAVRVCHIAGVPPVTLHGLRRSFASLTEWVEVPTGIVAQIMGHKPSATAERHYKVRPLDLLRAWHTKIEAWILEQAGIEPPAVEQTGQRLRVVTG